ncbi:hypothetical protein PPACK8108_LOCUS1990 [Phakopsora pachyrhizi]|uniref:Uncharacterized protein n=1 Tax=Phakopsora pachyrhizi TaxID=170000 RepID=A0AAV0AGW8_PHAPC|nr:hypothetical protein PPACK8108_LOCUS1990 [Phakopsora pachyrhizi]
MTYKSNKTFPWLGHSTTGLQVATQGGKSLGFIISMPITRHRSCSHNLTLIRFPYLSKDLQVSAAELGSKYNKPYTQSLEEEGQGVEDERSERQRTDKDSRKFYNLMMGLTLAQLPGQLPILLTTTKPLVKKKSSNSPKPQQRLVTNSHKPEAKKSFIAPQSDACKDQVSTTLVKRLRSQNTASKEQIKIDKRRQNTKDVQEHTCPVETIGQTMLNVSQNQSHFECPIVQELTKPVVVDVAFLNHVVSQDKGWTECPLVSESHYKHGRGAGFLTSVSVVLNTRSWFGLLVLVVWNILKNILLSP